MAARETLQARRAALLMHGLPVLARQKVVARLSAAELARLNPLIDELKALGLSRLLGRDLQYAATHASETSVAAHARAARLNVRDVTLALEDCAPAIAACL